MSKDHVPSPASAQPILETDFVRDALERLCEGLGARAPFLLITGEAGTGKTTLLRAAIERWGARATVAFVADPAMSRTELLEEIVRRFGAEPPAGASKPQLIASLEAAIASARDQGRVPVVVIDDAHEIPGELLGELRLLGNVSAQAGGPLEIVLAGLPALEARLADPALEALRQRIAVQIVTQPLSAHQARRFVQEVVAAGERDPQGVFTKKTCRELFTLAGGVPRTLGTLAAEALRLARRAGEAQVSPARVAEAARELGIEPRAAGADPAPVVRAPRPTLESKPSAAGAGDGSGPETDDAGPAPAPPARADSTEPASASDGASEPLRTERRVADRPHGARPVEGISDDELKPPGDPRKVSDWVGRFISPEEPRFGDLIGTGRLAEFADIDAGFGPEGDAVPDEVLAKLRRRRGRVLPRYRRGRRHAPEWLGTLALVLVIVAALVTIAGPARRMIVAGMNAMSVAAEQSQREHEAKAAEEAAAEARVASQETASAKRADRAAKTPSDRQSSSPGSVKESQPARPAAAPARTRAAEPEPYTPPAPAATASSTSVPNAGQLWALDAGTYADAGSAQAERERLVEATSLKGWLVRAPGGYRVVLGIYSTRERAENGAWILRQNGLSSDATAIPLPPRSQRQ